MFKLVVSNYYRQAMVLLEGFFSINPNQCGLFGLLRMRIAVSGHSNFGTDQTNIVLYESWHLQLKFETSLRSLRLIVWPQEVSEVTDVKMKKI